MSGGQISTNSVDPIQFVSYFSMNPTVRFERERQFTELFDPYEQVLAQSAALTPLGRVLWETVAERLRSSSADSLDPVSPAAKFHSTEREVV